MEDESKGHFDLSEQSEPLFIGAEEYKEPTQTESELKAENLINQTVAVAEHGIPEEIKGITEEGLFKRKEGLKELPYFPATKLLDVLEKSDGEREFSFVETDKIVGSISLAHSDWSTEYGNREGRIVDIAKGLINPTIESVEGIFHVKKQNEQIKLKKVSGPAGDIYFAMDGSHRISGCKLTEIPKIPAYVEGTTNPSEVKSNDEVLAWEWQEKINSGLIKGSIEKIDTEDGKTLFKLKIEEQIVPWAYLPQSDFIKLSKVYERCYPGAFDKLDIPKEIFTDPVALNFYLKGRYNEYKKQ